MTTESPKYPNIEVRLSGQDGNSWSIISRVRDALRRAGVPGVHEFTDEAIAGDYDDLLATVMRWVRVS